MNRWIEKDGKVVGAEYDGEIKTYTGWGSDPRCPVKKGGLRLREKKGMTVDEAFTTPLYQYGHQAPRSTKEEKPMDSAGKKCEWVLNANGTPCGMDIDGVFHTIVQITRLPDVNITKGCLRGRWQKGKSAIEALTEEAYASRCGDSDSDPRAIQRKAVEIPFSAESLVAAMRWVA